MTFLSVSFSSCIEIFSSVLMPKFHYESIIHKYLLPIIVHIKAYVALIRIFLPFDSLKLADSFILII